MAKRSINSVDEMARQIALRKLRAAKSRFEIKESDEESPRDVYLSSCGVIALHFAPLGYKYAKSGPHFTKQNGDLIFKVSFQSSHNNVAGEHVALWIHINVFSQQLKKWRREQPYSSVMADHLAGGQIGNLLAERSWYEWNLALLAEREAMIQDAVSTIERVAIPYFSNFEDIDLLASNLEVEEIPGLGIESAVEFLLCHGRIMSAVKHIHVFMKTHQAVLSEYPNLVEEHLRTGLPKVQYSSYAATLARVIVAYNLAI